ncbi:putative capsid protein [Gastropod associated circular ssDNA virus]|uniref:putative capsid protein n=1 Tax=Gastropod associated circular ssDNA virus TaxID=1296573 RepID=UPI0002B8AF93|nr:putative capsid protein [Gastropod associated circular ssDNA virus]AGG11722.1 putative capsid protein [Gastropod associated circular ssDNA virus]
MNMAKRTNKTHAQRAFQIDTIGGSGQKQLIQLDACLSKLNHRLYRQGRMYRAKVNLPASQMPVVNSEPFPQFPQTKGIEVWALMDTWYVHAMWKQAKRAYDRALSDEKKALAQQNIARWRDFRVDSGQTGLIGPAGPEGLSPLGYKGTTTFADFDKGMFAYSTVENLDNGNNMTFTFGDGTMTQFSMPEQLSLSRNESASPETVITQMPYNQLNAEGEDADYQELQANGSEPPYDADAFPKYIWTKVGTLGPFGTAIGAGGTYDKQIVYQSTTGYFDAPCGMVLIENHLTDGDATVTTTIDVEVQAGNYLGVHASVMG